MTEPSPPPEQPLRLVEQRVVGTELRTRHHDDPSDGPEPRFLERLPQELAHSVPLPLPYHLAQVTGYGAISVRLAASSAARARFYACRPFYKPVSRCIGGAP